MVGTSAAAERHSVVGRELQSAEVELVQSSAVEVEVVVVPFVAEAVSRQYLQGQPKYCSRRMVLRVPAVAAAAPQPGFADLTNRSSCPAYLL